MKALISAIGFLTVLPLTRAWTIDFWAPVFFAPVGLLVAGAPTLVGAVLGGYLPRGPVALVQVSMWIIMTGALHLDGLVDVADALGVRDRATRLAVLKDSRVGTYGLVAGCLAILGKWQLLAVFSGPVPMLLAGLLSRGAAGTMLGIFRPARPGLAEVFGRSVSRSVVAGIVTLALATVVGGVFGALLALVVLGVTALLLALQSRLFGGVTGDCYGAAIELMELLVLLLGGLASSTSFP